MRVGVLALALVAAPAAAEEDPNPRPGLTCTTTPAIAACDPRVSERECRLWEAWQYARADVDCRDLRIRRLERQLHVRTPTVTAALVVAALPSTRTATAGGLVRRGAWWMAAAGAGGAVVASGTLALGGHAELPGSALAAVLGAVTGLALERLLDALGL